MTGTNGHTPPLTDEQIAAKNGFALPEAGHTCRNCGAPIECDYRALIETRRLAQSVAMTANNLERQLAGIPHPKRSRKEFSVDEARILLGKLGSFRAVARHLGVNAQTVKRAVVPREEWPPSMQKLPAGVTLTRREK